MRVLCPGRHCRFRTETAEHTSLNDLVFDSDSLHKKTLPQGKATTAASDERLSRWPVGSEEVETADGERKVILIRPRDQIAAVRAPANIARTGVLPKGRLVLPQNEERPNPPPPSFPGLNWSRVQATAPDGSTVVVERPEVTEGESLPEEQPEARHTGNDTC